MFGVIRVHWFGLGAPSILPATPSLTLSPALSIQQKFTSIELNVCLLAGGSGLVTITSPGDAVSFFLYALSVK